MVSHARNVPIENVLVSVCVYVCECGFGARVIICSQFSYAAYRFDFVQLFCGSKKTRMDSKTGAPNDYGNPYVNQRIYTDACVKITKRR